MLIEYLFHAGVNAIPSHGRMVIDWHLGNVTGLSLDPNRSRSRLRFHATSGKPALARPH
jgi:hypothetical protein